MNAPEVLLAGPTAVGKTEVALQLAERLDGEIISVDSMQVYRSLDIGTAKPTTQERARVPHHLIDILDLHETFDAAQFVRRASDAIREIRGRNRLPILCGGTGLYFKAWLEGIGSAPAADPQLRVGLERLPPDSLFRELRDADQVIEHLEGKRNLEDTIALVKLRTRQYAKRQLTWFRHQANAHWADADDAVASVERQFAAFSGK